MVPNLRFYFIGLFCILAFLSSSSQVLAEQLNQSVKDCIENPETCGEQAGIEGSGESKQIKSRSDNIQSPQVEEMPGTVGITAWDFGKMILATIFVVALLYVVLKFVNKKSTIYKSSQLMENLGGVPLGSNRSVQIIKIGNRLFIVGVGENIQLLKEIDEEEEYKELLAKYNRKLDQLAQPNRLYTIFIDKVRKQKNDKSESSPPFQSMLRERLNELSDERKRVYEEVEKSEGTDKQ